MHMLIQIHSQKRNEDDRQTRNKRRKHTDADTHSTKHADKKQKQINRKNIHREKTKRDKNIDTERCTDEDKKKERDR